VELVAPWAEGYEPAVYLEYDGNAQTLFPKAIGFNTSGMSALISQVLMWRRPSGNNLRPSISRGQMPRRTVDNGALMSMVRQESRHAGKTMSRRLHRT